ncbi:nucleotide exchange factor GrpE [Candidatus Vidania fulgoroideorum]
MKNKKDYKRLKEKYKNMLIDFEKSKDREEKKFLSINKFSDEKFIKNIIPILDSLEITLKFSKEKSSINGIKITIKLIKSIFKNNNVIKIFPKKFDKFNPKYHHAIMSIKKNFESNLIFNVLQKGYIMFDRVVRPALVSVTI